VSDEIQADGTIESLKTVVNTIKTYAIPEYPENELGQVPFIRAVLDAVVSQVEASIARQETDRETAAANEKYIFSIPALCRGEEVTCALHVSQPIHDLRQQLATITQERDYLKQELDVTEKASAIFEQNSAACAEEFEGRLKAEKERDALRECLQELIAATEGEFHTVAGDQYQMLCPGSAIKVNTTTAWIVLATGDRSAHKNKDRVAAINAARTKSLSLLTPSGEAGKGGGA